MSIYDILEEHELIDRRGLSSSFATASAERLFRFYEDYRMLYTGSQFRQPPAAEPDALDVFMDTAAGHVPTAFVSQLALYANRILLHDPVLARSAHWLYPELSLRLGERESPEDRLVRELSQLALIVRRVGLSRSGRLSRRAAFSSSQQL